MRVKFNSISIISVVIVSISLFACSIDDDLSMSPTDLEQSVLEETIASESPLLWSSLIADRSLPITNSEEPSSMRVETNGIATYPAAEGLFYYNIFEDLFPNKGDYDLNDVVLKHRVTITNIIEKNNKDDGWKGYIDSWLLNDGAANTFKIGLILYKKLKSGKFQRIINNNTKIGFAIDPAQVPVGNDPWMEDIENIYAGASGNENGEIFHNYYLSDDDNDDIYGVPGKKIYFEVSGLSEGGDSENKIWITFFISVDKINEDDQKILLSGYPTPGSYTKFNIGEPLDYLREIEVENNGQIEKKWLPFGLEFIASEIGSVGTNAGFTPQQEGQSMATNSDFVNWVEGEDGTAQWYK